MEQTPRHRTVVAALVAVLGLVATVILGATALDTSPTQVSAPHELVGLAEFSGEKAIAPSAFYNVPAAEYDGLAPGSVIKAEPIADAPAGIQAQRLVYVSQTAGGQNNAVSAMYVTRSDPSPGPNGRPLVVVAHGTTGIAPGCGISIAPFTKGSSGFGTWDQIIAGLVGAGFAVVATDYANLGVPGTPDYLTMRGEGADVLNSARAVLDLDRDGIDRGNVGLLGHSQGGHAALSAAYIAPEYAPELSIKGTVAIAPALFPPAPVLKTFITAGMDQPASGFLGFTADIVNSWAANYPGQISLEDVYTPAGVEAARVALTQCQDAVSAAFSGPKKDYVKPDLPDSIVTLAQQNFPIYAKYAQPLLIQQGLEDTTVVPSVNLAAARTFCEQGTELNLETYPGDVHSSVLYTGEAQSISWLRDRFDDQPLASDCGAL
ncbi:MAG: alpha/beta fold hydrolase [Candidatus Nanopelagicales bacterium]